MWFSGKGPIQRGLKFCKSTMVYLKEVNFFLKAGFPDYRIMGLSPISRMHDIY